MQNRLLVDPVRAETMTAAELRAAFLVDDLFARGEIRLLHWEAERTIAGSAVPLAEPLSLEAPPELRAPFFCARRELGVFNLGGSGTVTVDGTPHSLTHREGLYVGRGSRQIRFESSTETTPALFYLMSHPCHADFPTAKVAVAAAQAFRIGDQEHASVRVLRRYIHPGGPPSGQLVMGITDLEAGSVWNTMPPHRHTRRTEIYLYFDMEPGAAVFHFMGRPGETRHLVVRNLQAVLSPSWSMHFAAGSSRYAFVWSMGGENQEFEDMQGVSLDEL
ncbi:MAG: 5-dehydro-4-deoxy-D-glucuronate isomerase [Acidobacteria bacterium]|nr:5-dehydro-4-deoxy-D-glucuronate isomerase [Acidobacteriota bacterium]MCK6681526.1 5-dehydro-4-deoxy-D-glucuronate isomerase [Thermoanaerobaculia bacterium]